MGGKNQREGPKPRTQSGINQIFKKIYRGPIPLLLAALAGFAANSLLARGALGASLIDASSYTLVRLGSGAATLSLVDLLRRRKPGSSGGWQAGAALAAYATAFSFSYLRIGAALGALVLFPTVKITLLVWGAHRGEKPPVAEWMGAALALGGLLLLSLPGVNRADPLGVALMVLAGVAWAVYTWLGKCMQAPLSDTAGNFLRAALLALPLAAVSLGAGHATPRGLLLAVASGALASGVGYCLWYTVVPSFTAMQLGLAQISVPALASFGAVLLLGEHLSTRMVAAAAAIFAGIGLALAGRTANRH